MSQRLFALVGLAISFASVIGAEDEITLLTFDDNLIGAIENMGADIDSAQQAPVLIDAYHQLLTKEVQAEVSLLHEELVKLIPGFEVAYTAADSAEIAHIMSEMDLRLAAMRVIHIQHYTQEVVEQLTEAYRSILPTFGDEP